MIERPEELAAFQKALNTVEFRTNIPLDLHPNLRSGLQYQNSLETNFKVIRRGDTGRVLIVNAHPLDFDREKRALSSTQLANLEKAVRTFFDSDVSADEFAVSI